MDQQTLEQFRQRLQAERQRLLSELSEDHSDDPATPGMATSDHAQWEGPGASNHLADDATELFLQEEEMTIDNSLKSMVDEIDRALDRIDEGTYGKCEACGKPICSGVYCDGCFKTAASGKPMPVAARENTSEESKLLEYRSKVNFKAR